MKAKLGTENEKTTNDMFLAVQAYAMGSSKTYQHGEAEAHRGGSSRVRALGEMPVSAEPSCCRGGGMGGALAPLLPPSRPQRVCNRQGQATQPSLSPGVSARARSKHGLSSHVS